MNENKIIAFFSLIVVSLIYLLFVLLVGITRGKHYFFLQKKLKIGVKILILAGILSFLSCQSCNTPPVTTCYKPAPVNYFSSIQVDDEYNLVLKAEGKRIITGIITERRASSYIFEISDDESNVLQEGVVEAVDGVFDNSHEKVEMTISETLPAGIYIFTIYEQESTGRGNGIFVNNLIISSQ